MASFEMIGDETSFDVDETIFVAVGKDLETNKAKLLWAAENFPGKKICVLHVCHSAHAAAPIYKKSYSGRFNQNPIRKFWQSRRQNLDENLEECLQLLYRSGVKAEKLCIARDNVEKGIVDLISKHGIRWLVMGAASDERYSRKMMGLKSKKAIFVCRDARFSCHIWFICQGFLIYTRRAAEDKNKVDDLQLSPLSDSNQRDIPMKNFQPAYAKKAAGQHIFIDLEKDSDIERDSYGTASQGSQSSESSNSGVFYDDQAMSLDKEDGQHKGPNTIINQKDGIAITGARSLGSVIHSETLMPWKDEDTSNEADGKARKLESLCYKEMSKRKGLEVLLEEERQENNKMKHLHDSAGEELQRVQAETLVLEKRLAESQDSVKELEEKIVSAVELLKSFKKQRDAMRIEHEKAKKSIKEFRQSVGEDASSSFGSQILEFSFKDINEATNEFDQSWKIGDGNYGSVYRGLVHNLQVAVRMLPSYGSQSLSDFQNKVEILSRLRHPNLVTIIGTCPESRSLLFEFLGNGSLEDHLSSNSNSCVLSWETRVRIATELCSALLFLHSSEPRISHGNLKSSKVLLNSNFTSKIIDYGFQHLIPRGGNTGILATSNGEFNSFSPETDVYAFGIIILQLLARGPVSSIVRDVSCALKNGKFDRVLDYSAGDWPVAHTRRLAHLALQCCHESYLAQPNLSEILSVLEPMRSSNIKSASVSGFTTQKRVPSHFLCPVFQEVMKDPLIAADGFTYEADAIRGWLHSGHDTSPMTNLKLDHCNLLPNHALFQAIQQWERQL